MVDCTCGGFDNDSMSRTSVVILIFTLLFLFSCEDDSAVSAALGEIPDTVSENFRQVTVSPTGRLEVSAGRVEHFGESDSTVFMDTTMVEFNSSMEKTLEGSAQRIELAGNQNGSARGGIIIQDYTGDTRLESEYLEWDNKKRILTGEGEVRIESGDGIIITGDGFTADTARETYRFSKGVKGTLEINDEG
ncbi:MAG: LPS export ABC transporter periplasmic protein LptC [Spirochaetes bacterium]|nr:MAG: LPS export ABC transporter periplasmic protein LptC [Spirochaetota bacterium]RKX98359.1 MAG: LPS export ABC transporter periplasmic protein LptC [Spirochaetota bacterium]